MHLDWLSTSFDSQPASRQHPPGVSSFNHACRWRNLETVSESSSRGTRVPGSFAKPDAAVLPLIPRKHRSVVPVWYGIAMLLVAGCLSWHAPTVSFAIETDPAVLAILESDPQTPSAKVRAARVLVNLHRHDLASELLQQIVAAKQSRSRLVKLYNRFGPGVFISFAQENELQPAGAELARQVLEAAEAHARDPKRIAMWLQDLASENEAVRHASVAGLRRVGAAAVGPLLQILADQDRSASHRAARKTVLQLGKAAVDPLVAAMASDQSSVRIEAIQLLGQLKDTRAVSSLVGLAYSSGEPRYVQSAARQALEVLIGSTPQPWEAEELLLREIEQTSDGNLARGNSDIAGQTTRWRWREKDQSLEAAQVDLRVAQAERLARLAEHLSLLRPQRHDYWVQATLARLEAAKLTTGIHRLLPAKVHQREADISAELLEEVLQLALDRKQPAAAIACLELLEFLGSRNALAASSSQPRTLVQALKDPHPRVRFAAVRTIMKLDPVEPYAGSSLLVKTLVELAQTTGKARALIGFPNEHRGSDIAGMLEELGFVTDLVSSSKAFFELATKSADYDLALLSDAISWPNANQLIQSLRTESRTAKLPIALMARDGNREATWLLAGRMERVLPVMEPYTIDAMRWHVGDLLELQTEYCLQPTERLAQAQQALSWLVRLATNRDQYGFYELLGHERQLAEALWIPELNIETARLMGMIGSPTAQRALVNSVNAESQSIAFRQVAADAIHIAIERRGLLLTKSEILAQYEKYNSSRHLDKEIQVVLGSVLDAFESQHKGGAS